MLLFRDCFCAFESNVNYSGTVDVSNAFEIRKLGLVQTTPICAEIHLHEWINANKF